MNHAKITGILNELQRINRELANDIASLGQKGRSLKARFVELSKELVMLADNDLHKKN